MNPPLVSILINNYNYGRFLGDAIDSALGQTYSNLEIVVVDDGSQDNSFEVIKSYGDKIIPVFKENGGQASAFNAGFQASRGSLIFILDSDDKFYAGKVTEIVKIFESNPEIGWCFHPLEYVDTNSNKCLDLYPPAPKNADCPLDFRTQIQEKATIPTWRPATTGLCFKRSLLEQILPMPEAIKISSDYYLSYAAISLTKGFFCDRPLAMLRVHDNNAWTFKSDKLAQKAKIFILTAYWLRVNFPSLKKLANKYLGLGRGTFWWLGKVDSDSQEIISKYLVKVSPKEKLEITIRTIYHWFKKIRQNKKRQSSTISY